MVDLKQKLEAIVGQFLKDTGLEQSTTTHIGDRGGVYKQISSKLKVLLNEKLKLSRVAVYGNGSMTRKLFGVVGSIPESIVCIIDRKEHEPLFWKLENIPVIYPEEIIDFSLDVILIPSKVYEEEIRDGLMRLGFTGEVIGIHSWLTMQGINITEEFDRYSGLWKYKCINSNYVQYIQTGKPEYLLNVIIELLLIHDYCHALMMMEMYLKSGWNESKRLAKLKVDIEVVFARFRKELLNKETRSVMLFLVDSLNCEALENMPNLRKIEAESFSLKKVMNQYGRSRETAMSLLTGYQILKDRLYERVYFTNNDGELLSYLNKENFRFQFLAEQRSYAYAKMDQAKQECNSIIAPEVFFSGLCEMSAARGNTFTYMHNLAEIHSPFLNPLYYKKLQEYPCDWTLEEFAEQYRSSQKYIDEILWFYYNLLKCDSVTQIIMGDHGIVLESYVRSQVKEYRWNRKQLNPACIISDSHLGRGSNNNLIANYHLAAIFRRIIERTITKEVLENYIDEYVKLAILPTYNPQILQKLVENNQMNRALGAVGILTATDTFLHMENGKEKLYIDEEEVGLESSVYSNKAAQYRQMLISDISRMQSVLKLERYSFHNECVHGLN